MENYVKEGLEFIHTYDDLYVTSSSLYEKLGYHRSNKQKWLRENLLEKYTKSEEKYLYDVDYGLIIQAEIADEMLSNSPMNKEKCKAIADLISIEYHNFVKYLKIEPKEGYENFDEQFYKENIQPKVTSALESITKMAETPFINPQVVLPDELVINQVEYIRKEKWEKDLVSLQFKMDALKSILS